MGWAWKLLGAGAGAMLGGPVGALVGAVVGHLLDAAGEETPTESEAVAAYVGAFLARLAVETGNFDQREKELIADICLEVAGSRRVTREGMLRALPDLARNDELNDQVLDLGRKDQHFRGFLLYCAWRVASRDNKVDESERIWIRTVALQMGDTDGQVNVLGQLFFRPEEEDGSCLEAYEVLGLPPTASADEIRAHYRELCKKYHPDRYPTAEQTLRELAAEKLAQINRAYELLCSRRSKPMFSLSPTEDKLFEPTPQAIVPCFFCGQKCRLPADEANLQRSRCPRCQVLLLFEQELAAECLDVFREQRRSAADGSS